MRRPLVVAALAGLALATGACDATGLEATPACAPPQEGPNSTLVLMAQAVPTASTLPCIRSLPVGWEMGELNIRDGQARFWLSSDRDGDRAVLVQLTRACDVRGATQVPSEQPGVQRYERVTRVEDGYGGERYYVYPGGCTTYEFDLQGTTLAQPLASIAQALGFVSRDTVSEQVDDYSDGRLELDADAG